MKCGREGGFMNLEMVKQYLRIDEDYDDEIIRIMMDAAEQYIIGAVGKFDKKNPKARMLFLAIMQDLYENRVLNIKEDDKQRMSYTFGTIVLQLQCEELEGGSNAD